MADPFTGEIRIFGFNYPPENWAFCNGQMIQVQQNPALYSIIGMTYGGNVAQQVFALPNLQGRTPMGTGNGPGLTPRNAGDSPGEPTVTLTQTTLPAHSHAMNAFHASSNADLVAAPSASARLSVEERELPAPITPLKAYSNTAPNTTMAPQAASPAGGGLPHPNAQPYQVFNFCICLYGVYPSKP